MMISSWREAVTAQGGKYRLCWCAAEAACSANEQFQVYICLSIYLSLSLYIIYIYI